MKLSVTQKYMNCKKNRLERIEGSGLFRS